LCDAIEVSHLTPVAQCERLMTSPELRISSIHAPAPLSMDHAGRRTARSTWRRPRSTSTAGIRLYAGSPFAAVAMD
jgi:hypothetical protein